MVSVKGNVSQKYVSPNLEKIYPSGTKSIKVLIIVKTELLSAEPIAWKNTGNISAGTIGMKLNPMNLKPMRPISITRGSDENTFNIGTGKSIKHKAPKVIKLNPNFIEVVSVLLHRFKFLAA